MNLQELIENLLDDLEANFTQEEWEKFKEMSIEEQYYTILDVAVDGIRARVKGEADE